MAVADGEEVRPKGAEEVEDRERHEAGYSVRWAVSDRGVLCDEGSMGEHGRFWEARCAAGGVEGRWSRSCTGGVGDEAGE